MHDQNRRAGLFGRDFYVLPGNAAGPTCLQGLQRRFFCSETGGIMLRSDRAPAVAVFAFRRGEDPLSKARRAQEHFANSCDFDNVYTNGNDHD